MRDKPIINPVKKELDIDLDLDFIDDDFKLDEIQDLNIDFSNIDQALDFNFNDNDFNIDEYLDTNLTDDTLLAFNIDEA